MREAPERVLMTADARGGVWTYALELARGLREQGVEVLLAVLGGGVTERHRAEADGVRLAKHPGKLEWMQEPWEDVDSAGEWLLQLSADFHPDVVHLNGYAHGSLAWNLPVVVVGHSCVLSWWEAVRCEEAGPQWRAYRDAVTQGLHAADLVIAPSRAMLSSLARHYGESPGMRVIYNGRDGGGFANGPKRNIILCAGRLWDDAKNVRVLAEAAPLVDWPVLAAGEAVHPEGGVRNLEGLCMLGNLATAELSRWYARASLYALPALYEPFGYTALEAALSGCALVLSDIQSLREIWGDAAVYVPPRDAAGWREQLNALIHDPQRRTELANAARLRALQLNTGNMTREYLLAYQLAYQRKLSCGSLSSVIPSDRTGITGTLISSAA